MKILLSAYSCGPGQGSEPGLGWGIVRAVALEHEAWVLTATGCRPWIEPELQARPRANLHVRYVAVPGVLDRLAGRPLTHHLHYVLWQIAALAAAVELHRNVRFDLVHHVTYSNWWTPTLMGWVGAPFVWNSGCRDWTLLEFLSQMSWRSRILEFLRGVTLVVAGTFTSIIPGGRARLALTPHERPLRLPWLNMLAFPICGLTSEEVAAYAAVGPKPSGPFRLATSGRIIGWKGLPLALRAFARLRRDVPDCEYWIIGDGSERGRIERMARELGVAKGVTIFGWLPRDEALRRVASADVIVQPGLHEQVSYAILEAMALGRPVICMRKGGSAQIVGDAGLLVEVREPDQVVADIHQALARLHAEPGLTASLGRQARQRLAARWSWDVVGPMLLELYDRVARRRR